jgi:hypothetical protein
MHAGEPDDPRNQPRAEIAMTEIERRRVATGANHPASHFIGAPTGARNAGTVPRRGTRAPGIMLHRTSPLCVKTGLQTNLAMGTV